MSSTGWSSSILVLVAKQKIETEKLLKVKVLVVVCVFSFFNSVFNYAEVKMVWKIAKKAKRKLYEKKLKMKHLTGIELDSNLIQNSNTKSDLEFLFWKNLFLFVIVQKEAIFAERAKYVHIFCPNLSCKLFF